MIEKKMARYEEDSNGVPERLETKAPIDQMMVSLREVAEKASSVASEVLANVDALIGSPDDPSKMSGHSTGEAPNVSIASEVMILTGSINWYLNEISESIRRL